MANSSPFRFGAVILAAGASIRMGEPKQLLPISGKPLLVHTVAAALASGTASVAVVLGAHGEKIRPVLAGQPVHLVDNPGWSEGMASSLRTGLARLERESPGLDAVLFALCDQPRFSAATIARLVEALRSSGKTIAAAAYDGHYGAPALFARPHFHALSRLTGMEGARAIIARQAGDVVAVQLPELATDLDTPADYREWLARENEPR